MFHVFSTTVVSTSTLSPPQEVPVEDLLCPVSKYCGATVDVESNAELWSISKEQEASLKKSETEIEK